MLKRKKKRNHYTNKITQVPKSKQVFQVFVFFQIWKVDTAVSKYKKKKKVEHFLFIPFLLTDITLKVL